MSLSPLPRSPRLLLVVAALACGPGINRVDQGAGGGSGGSGTSGGGGGAGGGTGSGGSAGTGGSTSGTPGSFGAFCNGARTQLTGTVLAPNGSDPVPGAEVAVWAAAPSPFDRGVVCESCTTQVGPAPLTVTTAGLDGAFALTLDALPKSATLIVSVRKARFRKVLSTVTIAACATSSLITTEATLPGKSVDGELPRIAVSSGNRDHLERVLTAMGITEFDCVKGLAASSTSETCTSSTTLGQLLSNPTLLATYGMLFIACAPSNTYEPTSFAAAANLRAWVEAGGKLIVTDASYDFVEQAFPDAIDFMAPAAVAGTPQTPNAAEVGLAAAAVTGTVADGDLLGWLAHFPGTISNATVQLTGFLSKWAVMRGAATGTSVLVHGPASWTGGAGDVPLTASFEVKKCGRVIFTSYHTDSGTPSLKPQERILEYLMFQVGLCTAIG